MGEPNPMRAIKLKARNRGGGEGKTTPAYHGASTRSPGVTQMSQGEASSRVKVINEVKKKKKKKN